MHLDERVRGLVVAGDRWGSCVGEGEHCVGASWGAAARGRDSQPGGAWLCKCCWLSGLQVTVQLQQLLCLSSGWLERRWWCATW